MPTTCAATRGAACPPISAETQVLVGSAAFMNLMDIPLPQGLNVKSAVFCAINGELAGIFALSYSLHDTIFPALEELMREKIGPVLATRDFNLIPAMASPAFQAGGGQNGLSSGGTAAGAVRSGAAPQRCPHRSVVPGGAVSLCRGCDGRPSDCGGQPGWAPFSAVPAPCWVCCWPPISPLYPPIPPFPL